MFCCMFKLWGSADFKVNVWSMHTRATKVRGYSLPVDLRCSGLGRVCEE